MPKINRKRSRQTNKIKRWKTSSEKEILECFFVLDPFWNRKTITYVKSLVKLSEEQIYKWGYEKRAKVKCDPTSPFSKIYNNEIGTDNWKTSSRKDYNSMVDDLFPSCECVSDELSPEELELYDKVKAELMGKNAIFSSMNDLDKLLCERISYSDIILNAKTNKYEYSWIDEKFKSGVKVEDNKSKFDSETDKPLSSSFSSPQENKRSKKASYKQDEVTSFEQFQAEAFLMDNEDSHASLFDDLCLEPNSW